MPQFQPRDPAYADRVADTFLDKTIAFHWGGELVSVSPGVVEIAVAFRDISTGGPGMLHRSIVAALMDDACVLAALSLTAPGDTVATAEYKLNFPCSGHRRRGRHPRRGHPPRPHHHRLPRRRFRRRPARRQDAGDARRFPSLSQIC